MPGILYKGIVFFFLLLAPSFLSAQVAQVVFTTDEQVVGPGVISGTITIQLQNSSGTSNPATETMDVEFSSTSATGEFLSPSSENPVTKTISTGSANKNFRYRDSTTGEFTISVNVEGRTSGLSWNALQNIEITSSSQGSGNEATQNSETQSSTSSSSSSNSASSAHFSATSLSNKKSEQIVSLSAGRDRLGSVGSPLEFKVDSLEGSHSKNYRWNFGDGSEEYGDAVVHTYEYPGNYIVVLNAELPGERAVTRINVKIVDAQLLVSYSDSNRIEIKNNSNQEVSLFGRVLWSAGDTFLFPQDTIIKAGQKISFSSKITSLQPASSNDVQILVVGDTERPKIVAKIEEEKAEKIRELQEEISALQSQLYAIAPARSITPINPINPITPINASVTEAKSEGNDLSQPALVIDAASELERGEMGERGVRGWLETIKRFFLRTER